MPRPLRNRVREHREARGLSQAALGTTAQLSRQSVGAIEAGRATPAVDVALRLANALGCTVEDLFGSPGEEARIETEPVAPAIAGRVALARIAGRWVSYPLCGDAMRTCADGVAGSVVQGRLVVEPTRPVAEARDNVIVMGCAAALGLLADRLNSRRGPGRFVWVTSSSTKALKALSKGHTHIAGVHLVDGRTGEANIADVKRHAGSEPVAVVTLARWKEGLVTAARNPKKLSQASDLVRKGIRVAMREPGSGARRLLDRELRAAGIKELPSNALCLQATGHLEVAHAVSLGAADVGVATSDAAIAYGLDFIPLAEERYDLVIPVRAMEEPHIQRLFDVLLAAPLRRELVSLGYDVSSAGERIAEVRAA